MIKLYTQIKIFLFFKKITIINKYFLKMNKYYQFECSFFISDNVIFKILVDSLLYYNNKIIGIIKSYKYQENVLTIFGIIMNNKYIDDYELDFKIFKEEYTKMDMLDLNEEKLFNRLGYGYILHNKQLFEIVKNDRDAIIHYFHRMSVYKYKIEFYIVKKSTKKSTNITINNIY